MNFVNLSWKKETLFESVKNREFRRSELKKTQIPMIGVKKSGISLIENRTFANFVAWARKNREFCRWISVKSQISSVGYEADHEFRRLDL